MKLLKEILTTELRFLCFRSVRPDLKRLGNHYLAFGLVTAWMAGIGRYWDNPRADWWQYLGLGSVIYIFILALVLWLIVMPLRPQNWSYKNVLIFVGMTSPLGVLYAVPVERFYSLDVSQLINVWFLAIVATWRVILWVLYLKRSAQLKGLTLFNTALLPLVLIVVALSILNLEHVIFSLMAGLSDNYEKTANDVSYSVIIVLTYFSVLASPVLFLSYVINIFRIRIAPK